MITAPIFVIAVIVLLLWTRELFPGCSSPDSPKEERGDQLGQEIVRYLAQLHIKDGE